MSTTIPHVPFNGDTFIGPEIRRLVERFGIRTIIETGTWSAHSTREFAKMAKRVFTIDATHEHLIKEFGPDAKAQLPQNVTAVLGDSGLILSKIVWGLGTMAHPILFYLDAHGGGANGTNVNPLLEEMRSLGALATVCGGRCVICIHDFLSPGKPWGYNGGDWGRGFEPLSYKLIEPMLRPIFPDGHQFHYNEQADGCQRGIIYIYPEE
jgi:hypothetical protein